MLLLPPPMAVCKQSAQHAAGIYCKPLASKRPFATTCVACMQNDERLLQQHARQSRARYN